jgi:hypothetical protein
MNKLFQRLCLICFCIVLAAIPIGIFEITYLNEPKATFLGCKLGELAAFGCDTGTLSIVKEIILNLPLGLMIAPPFVIKLVIFGPSSLGFVGASQWWQVYTHPLVIYPYMLGLILILAIIHIVRMIIGLAARWSNR